MLLVHKTDFPTVGKDGRRIGTWRPSLASSGFLFCGYGFLTFVGWAFHFKMREIWHGWKSQRKVNDSHVGPGPQFQDSNFRWQNAGKWVYGLEMVCTTRNKRKTTHKTQALSEIARWTVRRNCTQLIRAKSGSFSPWNHCLSSISSLPKLNLQKQWRNSTIFHKNRT